MVDGRPIEAATFARLVASVLPVADRIAPRLGPPTEFELLTAVMFLHFAESSLDVALVEVGLGGRLDATHAWDGGVAVVTNVGLDHTDRLGADRDGDRAREGRDHRARRRRGDRGDRRRPRGDPPPGGAPAGAAHGRRAAAGPRLDPGHAAGGAAPAGTDRGRRSAAATRPPTSRSRTRCWTGSRPPGSPASPTRRGGRASRRRAGPAVSSWSTPTRPTVAGARCSSTAPTTPTAPPPSRRRSTTCARISRAATPGRRGRRCWSGRPWPTRTSRRSSPRSRPARPSPARPSCAPPSTCLGRCRPRTSPRPGARPLPGGARARRGGPRDGPRPRAAHRRRAGRRRRIPVPRRLRPGAGWSTIPRCATRWRRERRGRHERHGGVGGPPGAPAATTVGPATFAWGTRTFVMGVLNATPDSFSGDGLLAAADPVGAAVDQARRMVAEGADLLDVGGASSRPGHAPVPVDDRAGARGPGGAGRRGRAAGHADLGRHHGAGRRRGRPRRRRPPRQRRLGRGRRTRPWSGSRRPAASRSC